MRKINNLSCLSMKFKELQEDESFNSLTESDILRKFLPENNEIVVDLFSKPIIREDLALEQQVIHLFGCAIIEYIASKYDLTKECYEKKLHDELTHLLIEQKIPQKDFNEKMSPYRDLFFHLFKFDLMNLFAPVFPRINEYIAEINAQLETKYPFIESINSIKLGNIFKSIFFMNIEFQSESVDNQIKNLTVLGEYLANPDGLLSAPALQPSIEALKNEYLDENMMDFYGLDDFEYVQFLIVIFRAFFEIFDLSLLSQYLDESIILKEKRKKSVAALLYDLCLIAQNQGDFLGLPTYEEWYAEKQITNEMDDKRTWKLFQTRRMKNLFPDTKILA